MAEHKETVHSDIQIGGDTNPKSSVQVVAGKFSEKDHKQTHNSIEKKEEGSSAQSHKRTFSTGPGPDQKSVDDPPASTTNDGDVPPPNKKTKCESESDIPDTKSTSDDRADLLPLTYQGPNVFYGYADAMLDLFTNGEDQGPYWLKSMIMDQYIAHKASKNQDDVERIDYAGITCDTENLQAPEAKLLLTHFENLSGDWWYEVTLTAQKPEGMRLQVKLESSQYDVEGYIWGGKDLGEWWISDIQAAEGESREAMLTMHSAMF